jgi:ABC-type glycerol-3-phosphate transport system substrate-binding protein
MGKKWILLVMLALLLSPMLAFAGAGQESAQEQVTLQLFRWNAVEGGPAYQAAFDRFAADHPGVQVEMSDVPWGEFVDSMVKFQMAESLPDVFAIYDATIGSFYQFGSMMPLDDYLPAGLKDEFYPGQWDHAVVNGETVGITFRNGAHVLFYNVDMFRDAGMDPKGPVTTDDIVEAAIACTIDNDGDGSPEQYGYADAYGDEEGYHQHRSYMYASGENLVDPVTFEATMNTPIGVEALQMLVDLNNKYKAVPAGALSKTHDLRNQEFANGLAAMVEGGNWIEVFIKNAGAPFEWNAVLLPYNPKFASTQMGGSAAFVAHSVAANTEHPELAAALVTEQLAGAQFVSEYCEARNLLPPRKDVATTNPYWSKGKWPIYVKATTVPNYHALPKHPKVVELSKIMRTAIEKAMMEQLTVQEALDEAAMEWNKIK